jgi:hypothetical protein
MLRGRASHRSCRLHGDNGCEVQGEAGPRERAQDTRAWRSEADTEAQTALFPAPDPSPWVFVEQPVQDELRLARRIETRWPVGGVL